MPRSLIVLLHGVNARGRDMAGLARHWSLDEGVVLAPDAPEPSGETPGARRWFSLQGITAQNRPDRVVAARPAFDAMLGAALRAYDMQDRLDRVALVGFSQGAIMALDAVASGRWPLAAMVACSGRYATPDAQACRCPSLILHGDSDPAIPPGESHTAAAALQALGAPVRLQLLPGLGHWPSPEVAQRAGDFLKTQLDARPANIS